MKLTKTIKKIVTLGRHSSYQEGIELYNQGLFEAALEKFKLLTKTNIGESSLHYNLASFYSGLIHRNLGLLYLHKGDYADAIGHFNMALEFNPTHYEIYNYLGIGYNNWRKYQKAMGSFTKVLELAPELLSLRYKVAIVLYNLKKYDVAREELQNLVESNPKFADFHFHLGVVLAHERHFEEAQKAFSAALVLNPSYFQAKVQSALTLAALGHHESADQKLQDLVKEKPLYPDLYYYLGVNQAAQKDWSRALENVKKALEINPSYPKALFLLGILYLKNDNPEAAIEAIQRALELDLNEEKQAFAHNLLSSLEKRKKIKDQGREEFALLNLNPLQEEYLEAILEVYPHHLPIVPDYIEILEKFGTKWDRPLLTTLVRLYEDEIAKTPDYADYHYQLGKVYDQMDAWDKAIMAYSKALELNPYFFKARVRLYKLYLKVEMPEKAKNEMEILIQQDIRFPDIYFDLAKIHLNEGNLDEALSCLDYAKAANPSFEKAFLLSAEIFRKKDLFDQALEVLKDFKEKNHSCSNEVYLKIIEMERSKMEKRD
jgi:tetratricopeptide (TPR) repeat protein